MLRRSIGSAAALAVMLCFGGPAIAGEQIPFKGETFGHISFTPTSTEGVSLVTYSSAGHVAPLGNTTLVAQYLVTLSNLGLFLLGNRTVHGVSFEFTTASGDTLFGTYSADTTPTSTPFVVAASATAAFTGGTGRFKGATGGWHGDARVNVLTLEVRLSIYGTVSAPGAGKK